MHTLTRILTLTGATAAALAGFTAASSAAEPTICRLDVTSLKANDLQEPPRDEITLRLGRDNFNVGNFIDDQTKTGIDMGDPDVDFIDSVNVRVIERDFPSADDLIGSVNQSCTPGSYTKVLTGSLAIYSLKYTVSVA
jgi:hypothetical protein